MAIRTGNLYVFTIQDEETIVIEVTQPVGSVMA